MKNTIAFILSLLVTYTAFAQADAIEYNDMIVEEQNKIMDIMLEFNTAIEGEQPLDPFIKRLQVQTDASISVVEKIKPWEDGSELKRSALDLFKFYKSIFANEYLEMIQIMNLAEPTEADYNRLLEINEQVVTKEKKVDDDFALQQQAFAKRWNIELIPNELQEELDGNY